MSPKATIFASNKCSCANTNCPAKKAPAMSDEPTAIDPQPIIEELNTIITSKAFAKAERIKALLSYVVQATLNNQTDKIKGYTIGVEVFGRPDDFDPQSDTVVRVTAVRLRNKLNEYYQALPQPAKVQIVLPVRSYVPEFIFNEQPPTQSPPTPEQAPTHRNDKKSVLAVAAIVCIVMVYGAFQFNVSDDQLNLDAIEQNVINLENKVANQSIQVAENYFNQEDYTNAAIHYQKAANATPGNTDALRALGLTHFKLAQFEAAKTNFESALKLDRQSSGQSLSVAKDLFHLGSYYRLNKQFGLAEDFYQRALTLAKQHHNGTALTVDIFRSLAQTQTATANHQQADEFIEKAFDIQQKLVTPDIAQLIKLHTVRGIVRKRQGLHLEAIIDMVRSTELSTSHYGKNHSEVAKQRGYLGGMYSRTGQHQQALVQYEHALQVTKQRFGEQHPKVAKLYNNMASTLTDQQQYEKAKVYLELAMDINKNRTEKHKLAYALNLYNLGLIYQLTDKFDLALDHLRQSQGFYIKAYGELHPEIAIIWEDIGNVHQQTGDSKQAQVFYNKALKVYRSALGEDHKKTLATINKLSQLKVSEK